MFLLLFFNLISIFSCTTVSIFTCPCYYTALHSSTPCIIILLKFLLSHLVYPHLLHLFPSTPPSHFLTFLQVHNQSAASGTEELYDLDVRLSVSLSMKSDSDPSEDTACYTERTSQSPYVSVPTGRFIKMHFFRKEFYAYFPMTLLPLVFL